MKRAILYLIENLEFVFSYISDKIQINDKKDNKVENLFLEGGNKV